MPELRPFSTDTSAEVHRMLIERYRAMTPAAKARLVDVLTRDCEALVAAGIRDRHPGVGPEELRLRLGAFRIGRPLILEAFGWDPGEGPR